MPDHERNPNAAARHRKVQKIAHRLWEEEGRPAGRHLDHWYAAERLYRQRILDYVRQYDLK